SSGGSQANVQQMLSSGSSDPAIRIMARPHARLVVGSRVEVSTQLAARQRLYTGVAYGSPCPTVRLHLYSVPHSGHLRISANGLHRSVCPKGGFSSPIAGWLFAFTIHR